MREEAKLPPFDIGVLVKYADYVIRYRIEGVHRRDRMCRMQYLGPETRPGGYTSWNARPAAGTQTMRASWIIAAKRVESDPAKRYTERMA